MYSVEYKGQSKHINFDRIRMEINHMIWNFLSNQSNPVKWFHACNVLHQIFFGMTIRDPEINLPSVHRLMQWIYAIWMVNNELNCRLPRLTEVLLCDLYSVHLVLTGQVGDLAKVIPWNHSLEWPVSLWRV